MCLTKATLNWNRISLNAFPFRCFPLLKTKIDLFHSLQIPLFLLGLKSDLTALRQVDAHLASNLGKLFNAPFSEISTFSHHYSRRLVEICANIVLSCTGKRQVMDPVKTTVEWTLKTANKSPLTLRERRLVGEPIMKIGTRHNNPTALTNPVSHGDGKHSPKKLVVSSFRTASPSPDHERHDKSVDAIESPRPRASKSMPSARIRNNDYHHDNCSPNTSLSSSRLSPTFPSQSPGFVYAPTQSSYENNTHLPSPLFKPLPNLPNPSQTPTSDQYSPLDPITNIPSAASLNDLKRSKRSSKDSG